MARNSGTVPGLDPDTEYEFQVRVVDAYGNAGDWSNVARGRTLAAANPLLVITYDNGLVSGQPYTATKILTSTKMVGGSEEAFTLPTDQVGERVWYGGASDDTWFYHDTLTQSALDVLEWGGIRDQWNAAESTYYSGYGEQQIVLRLDNIATVAGTQNFKLVLECRWAFPTADANPGTSRILAQIRGGTATWFDWNIVGPENQVDPQISFTLTGDVVSSDQLTGLTLPAVTVNPTTAPEGTRPGALAAVAAIVTYDCLDGSASITVEAA